MEVDIMGRIVSLLEVSVAFMAETDFMVKILCVNYNPEKPAMMETKKHKFRGMTRRNSRNLNKNFLRNVENRQAKSLEVIINKLASTSASTSTIGTTISASVFSYIVVKKICPTLKTWKVDDYHIFFTCFTHEKRQ